MCKMAKKMVAVMIVAVMIVGTSTGVMANRNPNSGFTWVCCACRASGTMGRLMWNEDGTFMSRNEFEARLDSLITSRVILESDKSLLLERFDFCATYGAGATGFRGACGRNGRGMGRQGGGRCRAR